MQGRPIPSSSVSSPSSSAIIGHLSRRILHPTLVQDFIRTASLPVRLSEGKDRNRFIANQQESLQFSSTFDPPWRLYKEPQQVGLYPRDFVTQTDNVKDESDTEEHITDYLALRRHQNLNFCQSQLIKGMDLGKQHKLLVSKRQQATTLKEKDQFHLLHHYELGRLYQEACRVYQHGLDLVPNHVDLHVALGGLHFNHGEVDQALQVLERALQIDPHHANAQLYTKQIRQRQQEDEDQQRASQKRKRGQSKQQAIRQDVLLEQSFLKQGDETEASRDDAAEYASSDEDSSQLFQRRRKRKRKRKDKKEKRKDKAKKRKKWKKQT